MLFPEAWEGLGRRHQPPATFYLFIYLKISNKEPFIARLCGAILSCDKIVLSPVHTSNNVQATLSSLSNATSWTILSTMSHVASTLLPFVATKSNVASTLLLVWTGLYASAQVACSALLSYANALYKKGVNVFNARRYASATMTTPYPSVRHKPMSYLFRFYLLSCFFWFWWRIWNLDSWIRNILVGWLRGTAVERRSLAGELPLSCARPAADGWPLM